MKFFLSLVCLMCLSRNVLGDWTYYRDEVSYNDLVFLNASCFPKDSCMGERNDDSPAIPFGLTCSCHRQCWQLGTCCVDSDYRNHAPSNLACRPKDTSSSNGIYVVHSCPLNTAKNSIWQSLCEKEWNEEDDILMLSPVTSLDTSTTYRNFYCFKCHETTEKFISWNVLLKGNYENSKDKPDNTDNVWGFGNPEENYTVTYNQAKRAWVATMDDSSISVPVNLTFEIPYEYEEMSPIICDLRMVSDCPDTSTDTYLIDACKAYTAVVRSVKNYSLSYRNAHCALCNGESVGNLTCITYQTSGFGSPTFSFRRLIDVNQSGRNKVGQEGKCEKDHLWDPYSKKCRKIKCAIPGYVVKNGSCTPP